MTEQVYVVSTTNKKHRYLVVAYDEDTGMGTLKGPVGVEFEKSLRKDDLRKAGYKIERVEVEDAPKKKKRVADDDDES